MPFIDTTNEDVVTWKGLHLFHSGLSSCAQRVRLVLAEKGIEWEGHNINIEANEHATEWYQSINPNGVVPTLIVDGRVMIESIDIIDWLDETYADPPLRPADADGVETMKGWMQRANGAQHSLKVLSHEFLFKPGRKMAPDVLEDFLSKHKSEELRTFMRAYCSEEGFPKSELDEEVQIHFDHFTALDAALADGRDWLMGEQFTLADISWVPNVHRFDLLDYPLDRHPNLLAWYDRFKNRTSFKTALEEQEPRPAIDAFKAYCAERRAEGTDVTQYGPLAA